MFVLFFFFSSRRRHTRYWRDWSSDVCSSDLVMRNGKLLQMGTPDEIYNRPADLFVANFTGATNELTGTMVAINWPYGTVDFGGGRRGEATLQSALLPGDKVRIALRPETIRIGANGANSFAARVTDRRYQ